MDTNYTHQSTTMSTNSSKSSTSLNGQPIKKPVFITLQKNGNSFTFAKPSNNAAVSKIPKLSMSTSYFMNSVGSVNQGKNVSQLMPVQTSQNNISLDINNKHERQYDGAIYQSQSQPKNQLIAIDPLIKKIAFTNKNVTKKPNSSRKPSVAPSSIAISKPKLVKRTYNKKQPNKSSTSPKFNFPPPPPKIDFKVSTITKFTTTIDEPQTSAKPDNSLLPLEDASTLASTNHKKSPLSTRSDANGVPSNCTSFRKLKIDTTKSQVSIRTDSSINSKVVQESSKTIRRFSSVELREAIENIETDEFTVRSQTTSRQATESGSKHPTESVSEHFTESVSEHFTESVSEPSTEPATEFVTDQYGEIIKRLERVEALQLASAKRDAQILVAVKKLCLAYTKYNNDNDEIKKLLPMKELPELDAMDTRLIEDPVLLEKFRAYLRGFKTSNSPDNFSSLLSVLMSDELVDKFNLKGILGKHKLQGYKIIEIIQDLHKPMDAKDFDKRMRTTIELAKNRYHNDQYRKRQLQIKQRIDTESTE